MLFEPTTFDAAVIAELLDELIVPERKDRTPENAQFLIDRLLGKRDPIYDAGYLDQYDVISLCDNLNLLVDGMRFGWVKPDGEFLGCSSAAHEHLLKLYGYTCREVEAAGWWRLKYETTPRGCFKPTTKQRRVFREKGHYLPEIPLRALPKMPAVPLDLEAITNLWAILSPAQAKAVLSGFTFPDRNMSSCASVDDLEALQRLGLIDRSSVAMTDLGVLVGARIAEYGTPDQ